MRSPEHEERETARWEALKTAPTIAATTLPADWGIIRDARPASVHPIRCGASIDNPFPSGGGCTTHRCIHPANERTGVTGVLVHLCRCDIEWTEKTQEPDGSVAR